MIKRTQISPLVLCIMAIVKLRLEHKGIPALSAVKKCKGIDTETGTTAEEILIGTPKPIAERVSEAISAYQKATRKHSCIETNVTDVATGILNRRHVFTCQSKALVENAIVYPWKADMPLNRDAISGIKASKESKHSVWWYCDHKLIESATSELGGSKISGVGAALFLDVKDREDMLLAVTKCSEHVFNSRAFSQWIWPWCDIFLWVIERWLGAYTPCDKAKKIITGQLGKLDKETKEAVWAAAVAQMEHQIETLWCGQEDALKSLAYLILLDDN